MQALPRVRPADSSHPARLQPKPPIPTRSSLRLSADEDDDDELDDDDLWDDDDEFGDDEDDFLDDDEDDELALTD